MASDSPILDFEVERFPFITPFRISGHVIVEAPAMTVTDGPHVGRGEAEDVYFPGEDPRPTSSAQAIISSSAGAFGYSIRRSDLPALLQHLAGYPEEARACGRYHRCLAAI